VLAAARDELQLRNERRAEAMLSGQTRQLPQFANGPGDVAQPGETVLQQAGFFEAPPLIVDGCRGLSRLYVANTCSLNKINNLASMPAALSGQLTKQATRVLNGN
jgi:hypothetical protein